MKRAFWLVACSPVVFVLAGCGGTNRPDVADRSDAPAAKPAETESPAEPLLPPEPAPLSDAIVSLDEAGFDRQVVMSDKPVLVEFSAPWCSNCRALEPTLDAVAQEYRGRVIVAKVDSDSLANRYHVRSYPTMMMFLHGRPIGDPIVGVKVRDELTSFVDKQIAAAAVLAGTGTLPQSLKETQTASTEPATPLPALPIAPATPAVLPTGDGGSTTAPSAP